MQILFLAEIPDCPKKKRNHFSMQNLGEKDEKSNFIETRTMWSTSLVHINQRLKRENWKKKTTSNNKAKILVDFWQKRKAFKRTNATGKKKYQIEKSSKTPTACPIITFLRRPPVQSSTNKIIIYCTNGRFPINKNSSFNNCIPLDPFSSSISLWTYKTQAVA